MVSTFVTAAHDLGIGTLAEGIECPEESETCQQLGFNYVQGYLYGKPSPISDIGISDQK
jgi:EAL domain-containing protein (putative c-di-GMP-specific phosphodiesterase class I)